MLFDPAEFTAAKFREAFPEFSDKNKFPDIQIELYLEMAGVHIDPHNSHCRMLKGKRLFLAVLMMAAHLLSLALAAAAKSAVGKNPGSAQGGFTQSAAIGDVSVTKQAVPAASMWDWWLASTPYGQQLKALLHVASVGGVYIGGSPELNNFRGPTGSFY